MLSIVSLNPRFDGAFLNYSVVAAEVMGISLNPRFDGAFLNLKHRMLLMPRLLRLNPRFDGAFLN